MKSNLQKFPCKEKRQHGKSDSRMASARFTVETWRAASPRSCFTDRQWYMLPEVSCPVILYPICGYLCHLCHLCAIVLRLDTQISQHSPDKQLDIIYRVWERVQGRRRDAARHVSTFGQLSRGTGYMEILLTKGTSAKSEFCQPALFASPTNKTPPAPPHSPQ